MRPSSRLLSHIGSLPVSIPKTVSLSHSVQNQITTLSITGPLGTRAISLPSYINLDQSSPAQLSVGVADSRVAEQRARWGLSRSLISNAVTGVSTGYSKQLNLVGVGYRAAMSSKTQLSLKLGFAHPVLIDLPADVVASTPSSTSIELKGIDLQRVGEVAARIRSWRVPEPYNVSGEFEGVLGASWARGAVADRLSRHKQGKGIFVGDEQVRRKEVKKK